MSNLKDELENLKDSIDDAKDVLHNILGNVEQSEIDRCKGWVESVEGKLDQAEEDIDFSIYLFEESE